MTRSYILKLTPAVRRHYLFAIAGALWTIAGGLLCIRATIWLEVFPVSMELMLQSLSLALAVAGYSFLFFRIVQRNIAHIDRLPERACIFAFTAWRGYVMIALMMTLGITLRHSSIPTYYLSIPYAAMGVVLLIGSVRFYRQFLTVALRERT